MWLLIRIGVLYAVPVLAVAAASVYFIVLYRRVRSGAMQRKPALLRYACTLLLAPVSLLVIWITAELSSFFALWPNVSLRDYSMSFAVLRDLAPLGGYIALPIVVLNLLFVALLARHRPRQTPHTATR